MDRFQYLALMAGCLLVTLPLEFWLAARVYRRPRRLLLAVVPVAAAFIAWDLFAIRRDHWTFSPRYTTGVLLPGGIPLEEVVFFLVIPICGLLTYEAVGTVLRASGRDASSSSGRAEPGRRDARGTDPSSGRQVRGGSSPGQAEPTPRERPRPVARPGEIGDPPQRQEEQDA